jgi:hypothetical protein
MPCHPCSPAQFLERPGERLPHASDAGRMRGVRGAGRGGPPGAPLPPLSCNKNWRLSHSTPQRGLAHAIAALRSLACASDRPAPSLRTRGGDGAHANLGSHGADPRRPRDIPADYCDQRACVQAPPAAHPGEGGARTFPLRSQVCSPAPASPLMHATTSKLACTRKARRHVVN